MVGTNIDVVPAGIVIVSGFSGFAV